jgi:hypothetical protein
MKRVLNRGILENFMLLPRNCVPATLLLCLTACGGNGVVSEPGHDVAPSGAPEITMPEDISGLPYSDGRSFATLDEYLAWLEIQGQRDLPWYFKRKDGRYERIAGRRPPGQAPEIYTREELMAKYGFSR